jgi:hypothetical protein
LEKEDEEKSEKDLGEVEWNKQREWDHSARENEEAQEDASKQKGNIVV